MIESFVKHQDSLFKAFFETNQMLLYTMVVCIVVSLPLGMILFGLSKNYLFKNQLIYQFLSILLNALRSVPFLIFIFVLIPVNRFFFKTSFGTMTATLPLSLVAISIFTRFVEQAFRNVDEKIVERAISMGATRLQMYYYFFFSTIMEELILSFTSVVISILSYSTVMGVIGAGGLGDYAYRYGYQEYDYNLMYVVIIIFILYVFVIQNIGYALASLFALKKKGN